MKVAIDLYEGSTLFLNRKKRAYEQLKAELGGID